MNEQERLKANKLISEFLGLHYKRDYSHGAVLVKEEVRMTAMRIFNIFNIAIDCLAVVKKLGNEFDVSIVPCTGGGWCYQIAGALTREDYDFDTYEEAVAAAVLEVMK